ncbi:hypothetical protein BGZ81_009775 [Podila clonocystis]|nr:hypothetical protein BGZ81_009775 [Podila clonocystis]
MWHWLEYVTPLSDTIFDKLLCKDAMLSRAAIEGQVKEITNRVPRELVNMAAFVRQNVPTAGRQSPAIDPETVTDRDVLHQMRAFQEQQREAFHLEVTTVDDEDVSLLTLSGTTFHCIDTNDIPVAYTDVPVVLDDNGLELKTVMVAGLVGMRVSGNNDTIQPQPAWWIMEDIPEQLEA